MVMADCFEEYRVWRYCVQPTKYGEWGIFLIDSTGYFSVVSDFGNYAHLWTHHGCEDFREFLAGLEPGYLCSKLGPRNVVDEERSLQNIREAVEEALKSGTIPEDEKVSEEMALEDLTTNQMSFQEWCGHTRLSDAWDYVIYDYSSDLKSFAEKIFPRFVEQIRKDLE
jgi:hypothetical protein